MKERKERKELVFFRVCGREKSVCVCVCVSVREREISKYVCVCVYASPFACVHCIQNKIFSSECNVTSCRFYYDTLVTQRVMLRSSRSKNRPKERLRL